MYDELASALFCMDQASAEQHTILVALLDLIIQARQKQIARGYTISHDDAKSRKDWDDVYLDLFSGLFLRHSGTFNERLSALVRIIAVCLAESASLYRQKRVNLPVRGMIRRSPESCASAKITANADD